VDVAQLDAFDIALARHGSAVIQRRVSVIGELRDVFGRMHDAIAGQGVVAMRVRVNGLVDADQMSASEIESALLTVIHEKRTQELERRQVLIGPHRDDLLLSIDGQVARNFASQGQARSIVLGLKLSELDAAQRRGDVPLFLLDDLTSELDAGRRGRLVEVLRTLKGQVWVTTTDPSYLGNLDEVEHLNLHVHNGEITL
jgi:DNA replication and repair protein RecF